MTGTGRCDLCERAIGAAEHYVVKIEVFADPATPELRTDDASNPQLSETFAQLMKELKGLTLEELQDAVHRTMEYRLCAPCHRAYLANPLGRPRGEQVGKN